MIHHELMDTLMDHYENPRNFGALDGADFVRSGGNSGCGDTITVYLKMDGDVVRDIGFEGKGCMVSQAAASLISLKVKGMKAEEISAMGRENMIEILGKEIVVRRPRCSTLVLDTLKGALMESQSGKNRV
ncbi:iron-sulfur cluster assembly scaffold protein [Candidatus Mycalebacterium sp.]